MISLIVWGAPSPGWKNIASFLLKMDTRVSKETISNSFTYTKKQNNIFSQNWYQMTKKKFLKDYTYCQILIPQNY